MTGVQTCALPICIEFHDDKGNFVIQALWDDMDEQTEENKVLFRKWAYNLMRDKGYEIQ